MVSIESQLTQIYNQLNNKAQRLSCSLNWRIYKFELELHMSSLMYYENEDESDISYPIPVVQIDKLCDVEYWLDKIIITSRINIKDALVFDFNKLNIYDWELYGCRQYPYLFYNKNDNHIILDDKLNELIKLDENEIGIQIYLNKDEDSENVIKCIDKLRKFNLFYYIKGR